MGLCGISYLRIEIPFLWHMPYFLKNDFMKMARLLLILVTTSLIFPIAAAAATVPEGAAANDMNPCFSDDGWINTVGSFDCITAAGLFSHVFLTPPDGNNYAGGVQFAGIPGVQETIEKSYTNLDIGTEYTVDFYTMRETPYRAPGRLPSPGSK